MDLSGLIFVALALVWAVVLIPKALRNHDDVARTSSVDTTSDSARVLSRKSASPRAEQAQPVPQPRGVDLGAARERQRRQAAAAARRRLRVLGVLVVAIAATAGASAAGWIAPWAAAVPAGLTLSFLVVARVLVKRERAVWAALCSGLRGEGIAEADDQAPVAAAEPVLEVVARNDQGVAVVSEQEDTSAIDVTALREAVGAEQLWDPLPMTLPTYVDKPRATRSVRTIDLQGAGVSSSGHDTAATALVAEATIPRQQEPPEQRAVGS